MRKNPLYLKVLVVLLLLLAALLFVVNSRAAVPILQGPQTPQFVGVWGFPGKPRAREGEPSLNIAGLTGEVAQRTAVGFLLIDSLRRPIYANADAARILLYPTRPGDDSSLEPLLGNKIRAILPQSKGVPQADFHTVFLSGRRHYLCRAFHFGARSMGSAQVNTALLLLERMVQGGLDTSEIARQFGLTPREQETTELLMLGLSSKEIASRMSISPNTVKAFLRFLYVQNGGDRPLRRCGENPPACGRWKTSSLNSDQGPAHSLPVVLAEWKPHVLTLSLLCAGFM